jgi:hypothetical protein
MLNKPAVELEARVAEASKLLFGRVDGRKRRLCQDLNPDPNKNCLRSAVVLLASALALFVAFCVLSYHEEAEAFRLGETYDSIASSYSSLMVVAIFALICAIVAAVVYFGTVLAGRRNCQIQ